MITEALEGRHLLVTGVTGFLGKVWLAHLLHHAPGIGRVMIDNGLNGMVNYSNLWDQAASAHLNPNDANNPFTPLIGAFRSKRGGHRLNNLVLKALFADQDAWTIVDAPRIRDMGHAEAGLGINAANFAANRRNVNGIFCPIGGNSLVVS